MKDQVETNPASGMLTNIENTLDEPVSVTIVCTWKLKNRCDYSRNAHTYERIFQLRDVNLVAGKLKVVLMPRNTSDDTLKALRDCTCRQLWLCWLLTEYWFSCRGSLGSTYALSIIVHVGRAYYSFTTAWLTSLWLVCWVLLHRWINRLWFSLACSWSFGSAQL